MSCPTPRRTPVESSVLTSIAYALDATLEIEFRTGDLPVRRRPTGRLPGPDRRRVQGRLLQPLRQDPLSLPAPGLTRITTALSVVPPASRMLPHTPQRGGGGLTISREGGAKLGGGKVNSARPGSSSSRRVALPSLKSGQFSQQDLGSAGAISDVKKYY